MAATLRRNAANLLVLARTALVFPAVYALSAGASAARAAGFWLLLAVLLMDGLDGWLARRWRIETPTGGLLDTLGDRITENLLFVFLAWERLVPLAVPLIFLARSFCADFVRAILFHRGIGTFAVNTSLLGRSLVSSKTSRAAYLLLKFSVFLLGALVLWRAAGPAAGGDAGLRAAVWWAAVAATAFNLVRFVLLLADGRVELAREFLE